MRKNAIVVGLMSSLVMPISAMADTAGKSYIGFDYGSASYTGVTVPAGTYPNPGLASFTWGYRVNEMLAAEVGYTKFGDSSLTISGVGKGTVSASSIHVAVVGSYPLNQQFSLIGKAGLASSNNSLNVEIVGGTNSTSSAQQADLMYGLGAQFNVSQQVALRAQYESFGSFGNLGNTGTAMKATAITFGAIYNF